MIYAPPNSTFTALVEGFAAGLKHVGVKIIDADANILVPRTEEDIVEIAAEVYATDSLKAPGDGGTYILVWDDNEGNTATEELRVSWLSAEEAPTSYLNALTVNEVRERSDYLAQKFPDPAGNEELAEWIAAVDGLLSKMTGRAIGTDEGEEVPASLVALAKRAVVLKVEQLVTSLGGSFSERRSRVGSGNLASFSAGAYSESYFGPEAASKAGMLDPDPVIADILWALATEDKRAEWIAKWQGIEQPAAMVQSFEWGQRSRGY